MMWILFLHKNIMFLACDGILGLDPVTMNHYPGQTATFTS